MVYLPVQTTACDFLTSSASAFFFLSTKCSTAVARESDPKNLSLVLGTAVIKSISYHKPLAMVLQ